MGLASHGNVYNTCLTILRARGFELEINGDLEPDGSYPPNCFWIARKDGFYFCAYNPIELIGLVAVYDYLRPSKDEDYWWRIQETDVWFELMERAFPEKEERTTPPCA